MPDTDEFELLSPVDDEDEFVLLPPDDEDPPTAGTEPPLPTPDDFDPLIAGENVAHETVVLELHIRQPGRFKSIATSEVVDGGVIRYADGREEVVDPKLLRISKEIIDRQELKEINKKIRKFHKSVKSKCAKSTMLAGSMQLLPVGMVTIVDREIADAKVDMESALDDLAFVYDGIVARAKAKLGPVFDQEDYPPFSDWRAAWRIESQLWAFNVPAALASVNREIIERNREQIAMRWADTAKEVREGLRAGFHQMMEHFVERLGKDDDGKPKTFKKNTIEKVMDFLNTFGARDLTNDVELNALAKQLKQLMEGVDPKALRKDESLREQLERGCTEVAQKAAELVVTRERKFAFAPSTEIEELVDTL